MRVSSLAVALAVLLATSWHDALADESRQPGQTPGSGPIRIVAAENFYGDVAAQLGGPQVVVASILQNPDQDPHLFEASPSVARALSTAGIVIYNGLGYDPWIEKLLAASHNSEPNVIAVAALVGRKPGDNPHIWYEPATMLALGRALTAALAAADPAAAPQYRERQTRFKQSLQPIEARIAALRRRFAGTAVSATEPLFGYLFDALALQVGNQSLQLAVMNDTEPSASDIAAFERDLKSRRVKLLAYNRQAASPIAKRLVKLAGELDIPVVAASETEPAGMTYQSWLSDTLDSIERALATARPQ